MRRAIQTAANGRPRLSVFRSSKQIYAQVIDDAKGVTLAAASSLEKDLRGSLKTGADVDGRQGGRQARRRARRRRPASRRSSSIAAAIIYHGRVKALADAAREGGLNSERRVSNERSSERARRPRQ